MSAVSEHIFTLIDPAERRKRRKRRRRRRRRRERASLNVHVKLSSGPTPSVSG